MLLIKQAVVYECHSFYVMGHATGDKIKAIKYLRGETGLGLKESKMLIEQDFDAASLSYCGATLEGELTPGYYIDRVFELAGELSECYTKLREMGVNVGGNNS